jgi:uncharacterized protein (TIGR02145 family)
LVNVENLDLNQKFISVYYILYPMNLLFLLFCIALLPQMATAAVWNSDTRAALKRMTVRVNINYDNGSYKGQLIHGNREGLGMYMWTSGDYYFGGWSGGDKTGYGIFLAREGNALNYSNNCAAYIGNWYSDNKSGKGTCYDKNGNVIYYGDFSNDKPTGTYPSTGDYSEYKFQTLSWDDGATYVGETKNGKRHGYGMYVWKSGDSWFGFWEDGGRGGNGIYLSSDAEKWLTHNCDGDNCSNLSSICTHCYGNAKHNCHNCNGSGYIQFMTYQYVYGVPVSQWVNAPCNVCFGQGVLECSNCRGMGKVVHSYSSPVVPRSLTEKTAKPAQDYRIVKPGKQNDYDATIFTDPRDSKKYKIVRIGEQSWMAQNLNFNASGSKCYSNNSANCEKYGRLYSWAMAKNACPGGWHLPSKSEYEALDNAVGGENVAGTKLKAKSEWNNNGNGTDNYGFSALPGGNGNSGGSFSSVGEYGGWWSASEYSGNDAYYWGMYYRSNDASWFRERKSGLYSVRCLKD